MEVSEGRAFIAGVVDGLRYVTMLRSSVVPCCRRRALTLFCRKIGASKELSRKEREAEERENGIGAAGDEDDDDEMDTLH